MILVPAAKWNRQRAPFPGGSTPVALLTTAEAGDAQGLSCVQGQAALLVLDVGHSWHGIEVGLERQLLQVLPRLNLPGWKNLEESLLAKWASDLSILVGR